MASWIVTLDVLKSNKLWWTENVDKLNSNIRCIEIYKNYTIEQKCEGWIVTLDVLKS